MSREDRYRRDDRDRRGGERREERRDDRDRDRDRRPAEVVGGGSHASERVRRHQHGPPPHGPAYARPGPRERDVDRRPPPRGYDPRDTREGRDEYRAGTAPPRDRDPRDPRDRDPRDRDPRESRDYGKGSKESSEESDDDGSFEDDDDEEDDFGMFAFDALLRDSIVRDRNIKAICEKLGLTYEDGGNSAKLIADVDADDAEGEATKEGSVQSDGGGGGGGGGSGSGGSAPQGGSNISVMT